MYIIKEMLPPVFEDSKKWIKLFKEKTYADAFSSFTEEHQALLECVTDAPKEAADELTEDVIETTKAFLEGIPKKIERENKQIELNMVMAVYLIPAMRETKKEEVNALTEQICTRWSSEFKKSRIQAGNYDAIAAGFRKKMCYITTAVCESMNKSEDCYELNLLRDYRDNYMSSTEEGKALIAKYYDIAPTIVKRINKSGRAKEEYETIWNTYLVPCISMIEAQDKEACKELYMKMVEALRKKYMEEWCEN